MQQSQPDPEPPGPTCSCGRDRGETVAVSYRSVGAEFVFHRCPCGLEWTERRPGIDRSEPVTTDEVIEVHQCLAAFEGPISDLLGIPSA